MQAFVKARIGSVKAPRQIDPGALGTVFSDRPSPFEAFDQGTNPPVSPAPAP